MKFISTSLRRLSRLDLRFGAKPIYVLVLLTYFFTIQSHAQVIWGTISGRDSSTGSVLQVNIDHSSFEKFTISVGRSNAGRPAIISNSADIDESHTNGLLYRNVVISQPMVDLLQKEVLMLFECDIISDRPVQRHVKTLVDSRMIRQYVSALSTGTYIARVKSGNTRRHYKFLKD